MNFLLDSILLGLEYALLAVGVFLSFRILNIPDLTVDGSFTLGIVLSAVLTAAGHPFLGLLLAFCGGAAAGAVTGLLHTAVHIHPILAGILTMSGLYTINLKILGGPNLSLLEHKRVYDILASSLSLNREATKFLFAAAVCLLCVVLLAVFFHTTGGLCIRATGNNEEMMRASSVNTSAVKVLTLALSNALVALSGGILSQYQGFGDVNSGSGMIVIGLASVIIGEILPGRRSIAGALISAVLGSVIYRVIVAFALEYNVLSADSLKLLSAVIVTVTLSVPAIKDWAAGRLARKEC